MNDHDHHDHAHDDGSPLPEIALRVKALESILVEKGYIDPAAIDVIVETYETKVGPRNGARVVAKAWSDPAYADYRDKAQLPAHVLVQVRRFFEDYKVLEHKQVIVEDMLGPEEALRIIRDAFEMYRWLRRGELVKA